MDSLKAVTSTLDLVRDGVRRFILNDVSIGDFRNTMHCVGSNGAPSTRPLTGTAFRKIVKQAIAERRRKANTHPGKTTPVSARFARRAGISPARYSRGGRKAG